MIANVVDDWFFSNYNMPSKRRFFALLGIGLGLILLYYFVYENSVKITGANINHATKKQPWAKAGDELEVIPRKLAPQFPKQRNSESERLINRQSHLVFSSRKCSSCKDNDDFEAISLDEVSIKKLIIFTNKRSGSSFVGELFNRNEDAFYMFEPLFPFSRECDLFLQEKLETLKNVVQCNFTDIKRQYSVGLNFTKLDSKDCLKCGICQYSRHRSVVYKYNNYVNLKKYGTYGLEKPLNFGSCPFEFEMDVISSLCNASTFGAYKILRICEMVTLERFFVQLIQDDPGLNEKIGILHLIRDPRAIISSRLLLPRDEATNKTIVQTATSLCSKMARNILYADRKWKAEQRWNAVRYFRVRYEDVTSNAFTASSAIYRYFGLRIPLKVRLWIGQATNPMKPPDNPFSTYQVKDKGLHGWREKLTLEQVLKIQSCCEGVMSMMGYKLVHEEDELRNMKINLW